MWEDSETGINYANSVDACSFKWSNILNMMTNEFVAEEGGFYCLNSMENTSDSISALYF